MALFTASLMCWDFRYQYVICLGFLEDIFRRKDMRESSTSQEAFGDGRSLRGPGDVMSLALTMEVLRAHTKPS